MVIGGFDWRWCLEEVLIGDDVSKAWRQYKEEALIGGCFVARRLCCEQMTLSFCKTIDTFRHMFGDIDIL